MSEHSRVGIAGAGSIAMGTAAFLHSRGHDPMLWSPSGNGTAALAAGDDLAASGQVEISFSPRIAASAEELAKSNEVLIIALPAYGHKAVMDAVAPHVSSGQHVIISSHASFGALYLMRLLHERGSRSPDNCLGHDGGDRAPPNRDQRLGQHRSKPHRSVHGSRGAIRGSARSLQEPVRRSVSAARRTARHRALEPQSAEPPGHRARQHDSHGARRDLEPRRQRDPNVGRLLEALDQERLAIAAALDLEVRTIFEHFHLSFHVPVASISEMNQLMHARGTGGQGPATADSRYVTEDTPYGLWPTVALGELAGCPAMLHDAGVRIFSAMYGP